MKIVLINLKSDDIRENDFPLGLAYIAEELKENDLRIFDFNIEYQENNFYEYLFSDVIAIVGISVCTEYFDAAIKVARSIKNFSPKTIVIFGGHHVTFEYRNVLENHIEVDVCVIGEGENSIKKIAHALEENQVIDFVNINHIAFRDSQNQVIVNNVKNIDNVEIKIPRRDTFVNSKKNLTNLSTSRGCTHSCDFCGLNTNHEKRIKCINLEYVEKDIENICKDSLIDTLYITDPNFLAFESHFLGVISIIKKFSNISFFKISSRADTLLKQKEHIEYVLKSGCNAIELGIESLSQDQLDRFNKGISKNVNIEAIEFLKELQKSYEFELILELILFDPYVMTNELLESIDFLCENGFSNPVQEQWIFPGLKLFPGTKLREKTINDKLALNIVNGLPYWKYYYEEMAFVSSFIKRFQYFILPNILEIRTYFNKLTDVIPRIGFKLMKSINYLNSVSFFYIKDILYCKGDLAKSKEVYNIYDLKIKECINIIKLYVR